MNENSCTEDLQAETVEPYAVVSFEGRWRCEGFWCVSEWQSDLFGVLQECLTGLQLDRADHQTAPSVPAAPG